MSLDSEKGYSDKNEKLSPDEQLDTKSLLNSLAQKIADEYGIDISEVKKLINSKTETKLETLKSLLSTGKDVIDVQSLQSVIKGAKDVIEQASKDKIHVLKGTVEKNEIDEQKDFYITTRIIPKDLYKKAQNPKSIGDNVLGAGIGIINSLESTIQMLYDIGAGVLKTPYHIYLVVSGQAEYDKWKKM